MGFSEEGAEAGIFIKKNIFLFKCECEWLPSKYILNIAGNKKLRYDRDNHTRKNSEANVNKDLFVRAMVTGDIEVGYEMAQIDKKKRKSAASIALPTLPTLARPLVKNPEQFQFDDPYESDTNSDIIHLSDTDDDDIDDDGNNDIGKITKN